MAKQKVIKDEEKSSLKELEEKLNRMWASVDMRRFWAEVAQSAAPGIEAYRRAQAKSKAMACCIVFY